MFFNLVKNHSASRNIISWLSISCHQNWIHYLHQLKVSECLILTSSFLHYLWFCYQTKNLKCKQSKNLSLTLILEILIQYATCLCSIYRTSNWLLNSNHLFPNYSSWTFFFNSILKIQKNHKSFSVNYSKEHCKLLELF